MRDTLHVRCRVALARRLHQRIEVYKRAAQLHHSKIWTVPLADLKNIIDDVVAFQATIQNRVKISLALREIATQIESGTAKFEHVLALTRFWVFEADSKSAGDKLKPALCQCDLSTSLRVTLFKEAFVRQFLTQRVKAFVDVNNKELIADLDKVSTFMENVTDITNAELETNTVLADFVQAVDTVRHSRHRHSR